MPVAAKSGRDAAVLSRFTWTRYQRGHNVPTGVYWMKHRRSTEACRRGRRSVAEELTTGASERSTGVNSVLGELTCRS
eukprot:scaffold71265_cov50-Attheya_sp.AAC.2